MESVGVLHFYKEFFMEKKTCKICGYTYNPEEGDPENGIAPGTPFDQLPDEWKCPICNCTKSYFVTED